MTRLVELEHIGAGLLYDPVANRCVESRDSVVPADHVVDGVSMSRDNRSLTVWLQVAEDCNLRCTYCYAQHGSYGKARTLMTWDQAEAICDYLVQQLQTSFGSLKVVFFGGEPLLNFNVIAKTVAYLRGCDATRAKPLSFAISTNGLLLDHDVRQFIVENCLSLLVSMDGSRETHDRHRRDASGSGSYDAALANCRAFFEYRDRRTIQASVTYSRDDLNLVRRIVSLERQGFVNIKLEPVQLADGHPLALRRYDLDMLGDSIEEAARYCRERALAGSRLHVEPFATHLTMIARGTKMRKRCGAGANDVAITSDGRIYPCARLTERAEWELGDIRNGIDESKREAWVCTEKPSGRQACGECWASALCGGGCRVDSIEKMGDLTKPDDLMCEVARRTCTASLWLHEELRKASGKR